MARAIRWKITFRSLNGASCTVNIYQEGWTGSVTTLTGAAAPVTIEEDDTEDLLKTIRYKTGYLRVVEQTYGALNAMYPQTNHDHYVEILRGSQSVFTGYMQAQSFGTPYVPGPRVLEFPIISPLGLADGLRFDAPAQPSYVTLASVLKQVATKLDADITTVIFPDYMVGTSERVLSYMMNTLGYSPFNDKYNRNPTNTETLYSPSDLAAFLDDLCNCFGLIVHEMPHTLIFTRYDYTGVYNSYTVSTMDSASPTYQPITNGSTAIDLRSLQSVSNDGRELTIMPVSKLTINYDSDLLPDYEVPYIRTKTAAFSDYWVVMTPQTDEISSQFLDTQKVVVPGCNYANILAYNGRNKTSAFSEALAFSFAIGEEHTNRNVFTWKLYNVPKSSNYVLSFYAVTLTVNTDTHDTFYNETPIANTRVAVSVKNGSYYMLDSGSWAQSPSTILVYTDEDGHVELPFVHYPPLTSSPLEITFNWSSLPMQQINAFTDIQLRTKKKSITAYRGADVSDERDLTADNGASETADVSQTMTIARNAEDVLIKNSGQPVINGLICDYGYMFQTQYQTQIDTELFVPSALYYLNKIYLGSGYRKRITAINYDLWNDVMRLTAQGSQTL